MTTKEGNKLIAEFMGHSKEYYNSNQVELRYHTSWDWLMPVVEKIEQINIDQLILDIGYHQCIIRFHGFGVKRFWGETKIKATWKAVTEFIQWYNQNKQQ